MQNKRYIGIDPDIFDIGIAVLENKNIETYTKNIGEALVSFAKTDFLNTIFRVEAGWLNKSNWHTIDSDNAKLAAEKGRRTGENHGSGKVIVVAAPTCFPPVVGFHSRVAFLALTQSFNSNALRRACFSTLLPSEVRVPLPRGLRSRSSQGQGPEQ